VKVLVTGGSGFVGAWIVRRLLQRGVAVRILDKNSNRTIVREIVGPEADTLEWHIGDVSSMTDVSLAAEGCQAAVHLAGILLPACRENPVRGAEINLIGTLNLFEAGIRNGFQKIVYSSTAGVFGPDDGLVPRPVTHYGAFKLATEGSARAYWEDQCFQSVGFRPFVIYGPGRETGLSAGPSLACRAAARGEAYTVPYIGSAGYVYVDDVAAAFESALFTDLPGANVFNLVGEVAPIEDVIQAIRRVVPEAVLNAEGEPLPIASGIGDDNLYDVFHGLQRTALKDGIAATIEHYRTSCDCPPK